MDKVKVELLTQHEHAGITFNRGHVLDLNPRQANMLINLGKAKKAHGSSHKDKE